MNSLAKIYVTTENTAIIKSKRRCCSILVNKEQIQKAKEKLGDKNAEIIAELLKLEKYDSKNYKALCPWHLEDTPSFIYNSKAHNFHCFSCGKNTDILDAYMHTGLTYLEALEKLFALAKMQVPLGEKGVKTKTQYRYPKEEPINDKELVYKYLGLRKISKETVDRLDIRQDPHGNIVFNYYDSNDCLSLVKYRPSHKVDKTKGEIKAWCQKDADVTPLLFNMNRVNPSMPLLITEGCIDTAAAVEAGYTNAVSVPLGANNYSWIEENFDWLEQFDSIIICSDNDEAGIKMQKECIYRLGSWRTKFIDIPPYHEDEETGNKVVMKDLNHVLYYEGKQAVLNLIQNAKDTPVPSVEDLSNIEDIDLDEIEGITTGIRELDTELMKLFYGTLTVVSGSPGCVDCDTEYFNGQEWKKISEFQNGEKVLQYNPDGTAELVIPSLYHKYPCDKFYHISARGIEQMVSPEHNLVYITTKGNLAKKPVSDFLTQHYGSESGFTGKFLTTFNYSGGGFNLSDEELRVMCAVVCDGSFIHRYKNKKICRINIKKQRKKDRLEKLLKEAKIPYRKEPYNPKDLEYNTYLFEAPIPTKIFTKEWYDCNNHQLRIIADEIVHWDGSFRGERLSFSTSVKENADFVQFCFSSTGRKASIGVKDRRGQHHSSGKYIYKSVEYCVCVTVKNSNLTYIHNSKQRKDIPECSSKDGYKYCFTVPSGMLILRRNNVINITGNSGKTSVISQLVCQTLEQNKNVWIFSREMPGWMTKSWLNYILAGGNNIKEYIDSNDCKYYKVAQNAKSKINEYYKGKWFVYRDDASNKLDDLIVSMQDSVRKYGTKLLILDNLMMMDLESGENNENQKQTEAINKLIIFAMKYNVAVVLVAHPRKMQTGCEVGLYDISGTSNIINLAHRSIGLKRLKQDDQNNHDVEITIIKDRMRGRAGKKIQCFYDIPSRRFYTNENEYNYQYSWDDEEHEKLPYPHPEEYEIYGDKIDE